MLRVAATKNHTITAVAIHRITVIRVIAKCTPNRSKVASGLGKNSRTLRAQTPGSLRGHSEARTMLALTGTPLSLGPAVLVTLGADHPAFPYLSTTRQIAVARPTRTTTALTNVASTQ